ncbi:hypothetical protein PSA7680_03147 [Pseudoruegeria aquimaris]|uniref:DUF3313 domain-containing protein n=1 Tax=Pseudoruegeria aquimaris TaxID=393663 RepID=A0A1Y5TED0_9RHOB|nr:hypothetical protein [Pseudoruegeria aquimaris]SLN60056.1 hypothetical protein PSA7680_03147 [Pseudoruegeria aquimaris]
MRSFLSRRAALGLLALPLLAACAGDPEVLEPPKDLGEFRLGRYFIYADDAQVGPLSKDVTADEWENIMSDALVERLGRYRGGRSYDIGINIVGYVVAVPGVPVVASPKSVLVAMVNIWDQGNPNKLNAEPKQITVLESFTAEGVISSGLTMSSDEQMQQLSRNAVRAIEEWIAENPEWTNRPSLLEEGEIPAPSKRIYDKSDARAAVSESGA